MVVISWMIVILFFISIYRFLAHRKTNHQRASDYAFVGHAFLFIGACMYAVGASTDPEVYKTSSDHVGYIGGLVILFGFPAVFFYVFAKSRQRKMRDRYKAYYQLVIDKGMSEVDQIAVVMRLSRKETMQDLEYLIATGIIPDLFEEGYSAEEECSDEEDYVDEEEYDEEYDEEVYDEEPEGPVPVVCSGCGATSTVNPGKRRTCEYCGRALAG
ncbi:hypothetical protein [Cohnella soli]|uniref:Zinc ribbon domain-containing protein n=1 Tax=Cohnella soli TaxID=425005 RepID=A0ABW0HPZ2_9BACL